MNKDETDKLLIDMSGDIKVLVSRSNDYHETLYGDDGVVKSMVIIKERQDQCPARQANTLGGRRLGLGYIMTIIAVISLIITIIFGILRH